MSEKFKILRSSVSEQDERLVCTVISLVPLMIEEYKPGLIPGFFHIDASVDGKPELLYVGECMHYVQLDEDRGRITVMDSAHTVARSIVDDYIKATICTSPDACPALWWEHGLITREDLLTTKAEKVREVLQVQDRWYKALIVDADDGWSKSHQHAMVSDLARRACDALGLERDWNIVISEDVQPQTQECPACKSKVFVGAVVCPQCRCVLDAEAHKKLVFVE